MAWYSSLQGDWMPSLLSSSLLVGMVLALAVALVMGPAASAADAPPSVNDPGAAGSAPAASAAMPAPAMTPAQRQTAITAAASDSQTKQREVARLTAVVESQQKALLERQSRADELQAAYDDQVKVIAELPQAKAARDAANEQVYEEAQKNRNDNTRTGGASSDSIKAQQDAEQRYEKLKAQAADAPGQMDTLIQSLHHVQNDCAERTRRIAHYQAELDAAQDALATAMDRLNSLQVPAPGVPGSASATAPAVAPAASQPPAAPR